MITRKHSRGFTLVEIMLAMALLVLIVAAIYSSWNAILKGSKVALDTSARSQRARMSIRTLQDSLLCACMFGIGSTNYAFNATMDGDNSTLSFVARLPNSFLRNGEFGGLNVRRVTFSVEAGGGGYGQSGKNRLVLRQRPLIMDYYKDENNYPLILADDVSQFKVEFLDPKTGDKVTDWQYTNQMPKEVYITIGTGHKDNFSYVPEDTLFAMVALPSVSVRPEWQAPANAQQQQQGGGVNTGTPGSTPTGNSAINPRTGVGLPSGFAPQ